MSFPILKYLALKTDPVTEYELEKAKLDIKRNGKNEASSIDKPTIRKSLKLMEDNKQVALKDRKVCRDGRVRKKYVVTPRGVIALLWGHPDYVELSKKYIGKLTENHCDFFPRIFDLWPEFIREKVEDAACSKLAEASQSALAENIEGMFLGLVMDDLKSPTNPDHDAWLRAAGGNHTINEALHTFVLSVASREIEDHDKSLKVLGRPELRLSTSEQNEKERAAIAILEANIEALSASIMRHEQLIDEDTKLLTQTFALQAKREREQNSTRLGIVKEKGPAIPS